MNDCTTLFRRRASLGARRSGIPVLLASEWLTCFERQFLLRLQGKRRWSEQERLFFGWIVSRHLPQVLEAIRQTR